MATFREIVDEARRRVRRLAESGPGEPVKPLIDAVILAIGRIGVAIEQDPALRGQTELAALVDDLQPAVHHTCVYLAAYPSDIVLDYARVWDGGELAQASWRAPRCSSLSSSSTERRRRTSSRASRNRSTTSTSTSGAGTIARAVPRSPSPGFRAPTGGGGFPGRDRCRAIGARPRRTVIGPVRSRARPAMVVALAVP